jgi:hypothetical protein
MTTRLSLLIASPTKRRSRVPQALASDARSAAGRPARKTIGFVSAGTIGTRSIPGVSAPPASTNGLRRSASSAAGGRRIRIGIRNDLLVAFDGRWPISSESEAFLRLQIGSKPRTAATTETKGYARAFRRAFDSQPRGRSGSGKFPEPPRRGLYPCRERACIANLWQINPVSPWEALPDYSAGKLL